MLKASADHSAKEKTDLNQSKERTKVKKRAKMLNTKTIGQIPSIEGNPNVVISD